MSKAQNWVDKRMAASRAYDDVSMAVPRFGDFAEVKVSPEANRYATALSISTAFMYPDRAIEFAKWILDTFGEQP